jgi:hypothetical protein
MPLEHPKDFVFEMRFATRPGVYYTQFFRRLKAGKTNFGNRSIGDAIED